MVFNLSAIKKNAERIQSFFLDLIFPIECLGCGREGSWFCADCFNAVKLKPKQYCLNCKKENDFGQFCPACGINYDLNGVWIAALYDDELVAKAVKSLKYNFVAGLAGTLSAWLVLFMDKLLQGCRVAGGELSGGLALRNFERTSLAPAAVLYFKANLIVPVPLSKKRLRWRGFNQAEILAQTFADYYGLKVNAGGLVRLKHKKPQAKLSEAERLINVKNCFSWRGGDLTGRNVILIDDVVTTGATLNECAKSLRAAGAGEIWGLVVAKG